MNALIAAASVLGVLGVAAYTAYTKREVVSSIWRRLRMGFKRNASSDDCDYKKMTPPPASRPKQSQFQSQTVVNVIVTDGGGAHSDYRNHLIETLRSNDDPQVIHSKCHQEQTPGAPDDTAVPSAKEKALADAARARLYGNSSSKADSSSDQAEAPVLPTGPEPVAVDVVYFTRDELAPINEEEVSRVLEQGLQGASSKQWTEVIAALNQIRQVSVHHAPSLRPRLHEVVPLVVQQVKSLRSSVCKTSLLCVSDLITDFGDAILPFLDLGGASQPSTSLLCQLLLKASSKDKKFVIEEAERSLRCICGSLCPSDLYPLLPPYLKHKNQKLRGAAVGCAASVLGRMSDHELTRDHGGLSAHLKTMGPLVSDKTKEAREASRQVVLLLHAVFSRQQQEEEEQTPGGGESSSSSSWEGFVSAQLGASAALTVLKITASPQQQPKPR